MSRSERRAERDREWEAEMAAREAERHRKECLCLYERIEEADCNETVKDILRRIAVHAGMSLWE